MNEETNPRPVLPPKKKPGMAWVFVGLAPIPIGLMMGPRNIFDAFGKTSSMLGVVYILIVIACSLSFGVGQAGGFKRGNGGDILQWVVVGIALGLVCSFVVFFAGCCSQTF